MYNPNVPSSNMGIAPISGQPSQPLGPAPMVGPAPMGPMGPPPPMMGGMPPPPMMAPPPMAPPIAPITEGLGGFGGSSAGRAGFSERMQQMTAPPKPKPMPQPMPVQRMNMGGAVSSQGLSMYQPPMMPRPMGMMGGVPNRVEPLKMALGGFIGNPTTRDYSDDDPFGTDDLLDSLGIPDFDPNKDFGGGGDDSGGDDDDYYNYLDDNYVYTPPPAPAPPVVVPEPESGGDDIKDRVVADLIRTPVEPTVGSSDPSVPDVAPDLATFIDLIDPFEGQIVQPAVSAAPKAIDAVGAAPIVGSVESGEGEGASAEVDVLGVNPISLSSSGITDRGKGMTVSEMIAAGSGNPNDVNVDISNIPEVDSDFTARRAGEILDGLNVARPGGSFKTRIEDDGLANAMAAAQQVDASEAFVEPTPAEIQASNRRAMAEARADDAALAREGSLGGADAAIDGGYQPNLRRGPFGPIGPESSFPGYGKVNSLALPADTVFPEAKPEQIGGGLAGASTRPGMGSDDPIVYNDTPRPQNTKYLSPFDISELKNLEEDYYRTGAGSSDYDPMAAQATAEALRRAEGDVSALDRIAEARMPTDDMQIVDDMRSVPRSSPEFAAPVGDLAQFEPQVRAAPAQTATVSDPDGGGPAPKSNFDFDFPNTGETDEVFIDPTDSEMYFKDRFEPNAPTRAFESLIKALSFGAIDLGEISAKQREKGFEAYKKTQTLAYDEKGRVIGVKDPDGKTILLGPQPQDDEDTGGDDDGCPPGFRKVNGVCMPIQRVSANPATAIEDAIASATLPNTLRPVVRDLVDDDDDEEETSDVGGLTIRRPKYFAGGGAVSEGMGSAIDSFISAMGGSVKKKSDVEPVGMARGGYVDMQTESGSTVKDGFGNPVRTRVSTPSMSDSEKDERNFSYDPFPDDVYGRGGRGVNLDPVAPSNPDPSNFTLSGSGAYFEPEPEPDNIVQRSLRPQLRPASFLNESFGDRRQRLAGGPNVFDGAGPSYDVAGLKTVNDAGYDPYVSNAISSVQDYYNDGSVGPTMQNAATLSIPTPSPMPVSVIPSLSNQTLKERGYSPIQHSPLYEEEFGYTPEESIFNDFSLNLQQNQLTEDEIEQMRIRASNRARKGILSDPYTTQGLGADYAEPKLSPGLYVDPETGKRSTTMSYRDQASQDEAMNALRLIGATDAQKDGDANTNELRAIAARKLVDMGVPNSLLGVATGYLDATPYGAGTALFDAYDSSKDTVGSLAEGDLKSAGKNAAITGLNLLGGVPGALQAGSLASSGIRAGTNKADDFFRQQFYNFQAQRDAMADVVPSTLAPYRSQNVSRANANYETLRNNKAKDAMNIQRAQDAYANGVSEQAILDNYGVSVYKQTDVNGQVERVRFAHAEPINSVNDVDLSKVTEAGVPISQAIKYPNNSRASVPPNKIQGMNTLKLTELTDDELAYGVGGSAYSNPITGGGYVTFGRLRDPLSGRLRPLTPGYKPLVLHEVEHIKQYDSFPNTRDFGPRGGISGYYDFKKQKLNEINQQLKDKNLTANKRADLIATRNAFKNMSASEMYNNSVKELKAKGAELGKFDPASGSGPMAVKTLSPLEIINPYFQTRGIRTLTERLNAALGSKLPSQNTAISISNTLENTAIALRKKGFSNQRIDEIIGNLSRKLKEESIQNSVDRPMQAKIGDENTMGDIFDARRTVDLPNYNRPLNESIK